MSWSATTVGVTPYQPPPHANGQPGYAQQQLYQYGQQPAYSQYQSGPSYAQNGPPGPPQRPPENRPPKKKGNPIITRYPPPPGYRGPAQPPGFYGTNQYPNQYATQQHGYQQNYAAPLNQGFSTPQNYAPNQGYSPQAYGPPQNYQSHSNHSHQPYQQAPNYQYPQQGYAPPQGHPQPPTYQGPPSYAPQETTYQGYPPQPTPVEPSQQHYVPHQSWQASYPPSDQYASSNAPAPPPHSQDPNATPTPTSVHLATASAPSSLPHTESVTTEPGDKPKLYLAWDDWDFDFDGAIWPKSNEQVDQDLSLGVIIWRPAKQVTRALPSTFEEAEEQALKPPAEKLGNGESVSQYFTLQNSHEAFLDVRQTDEWAKVKRDPVFVVFPDVNDTDLIPLEECIAKRDRPDEPHEEEKDDDDEEMKDSSWNVMDNLEQALSGQEEESRRLPVYTVEQVQPRNQKQEDILAMLGVTGSPKPPSDDPMPLPCLPLGDTSTASLPARPVMTAITQSKPHSEHIPQRAHSYGGHRNSAQGLPPQRQYGSMSASTHIRPPPPTPELQQHSSWNSVNPPHQPNGHSYDGSRDSPARSEASNRTLAGSDFDIEKPTECTEDSALDQSAPPIRKLERSDSSFSRKRSYDDSEQNNEKLRQQDDHTRRKRRSQVAAAYSRR